jgi:hypothetical protein
MRSLAISMLLALCAIGLHAQEEPVDAQTAEAQQEVSTLEVDQEQEVTQ